MKRQVLGSILLIVGMLIAIFGYFYGTNEVYFCPAFGCDPQMFDKENTIRYTLFAVGISISMIGIAVFVQAPHTIIMLVPIIVAVSMASYLFIIIPITDSNVKIDMQRILLYCKNPKITNQDNNQLVICHHKQNSTDNGVLNLPLPMYKITPCHSIYGCGGYYNIILVQDPKNLLTSQQKQQVIDKITSIPAINAWPPDWKIGEFGIHPSDDKWFADVQFFLPSVKRPNGECGAYSQVGVDLQTLAVTYTSSINVSSLARC